MISWKHSFNRLNEEYEIAKKKKQALDNLYEKGRISLSTHDSFNNELAIAIAEIEKQQQDLLQKMQMKTTELENQIKTLEMLLANYEIQHVAGEIDDNTYQLEINLLTSGLSTAEHELQNIREAANQLCAPNAPAPAAEPIATPQVEVAPAPCTQTVEVAVEAAPAEIPAIPAAPEPCIQEPIPEPVAAPEPITPVVEAAVVETPAPIEAKVEAAAEPIMEEPAPAAAVEEKIIEQPAAEIAPEPVIEAPVATAEVVATEQPVIEEAVVVEAEKVEVAPEPIIEEAAAVVEEASVDQAAQVVEAEVVQPEIVEAEVPPIVEEIMTANPSKAPVAAQTEAAAEIVPEVSGETQPTSTIHSAKEVLHMIESPTDSSEDKEA